MDETVTLCTMRIAAEDKEDIEAAASSRHSVHSKAGLVRSQPLNHDNSISSSLVAANFLLTF